MSYLNKEILFRLRDIEEAHVNTIVNKNPDIFENKSHFVRCAVNRYVREWQKDDLLSKGGNIKSVSAKNT